MSDDLIKRLRETAAARAKATAHDDPNNYLLVVARLSREDADLMAEAAAEIERLRDALAPCAAILAQQRLPEGREYLIGGAFRVTVGEALDKANAALA